MRWSLSFLLLLGCDAPPALSGVAGTRGTLLLADLPAGEDVALQQRLDGGDWTSLANASGDSRWLVQTAEGARYRLYHVGRDRPGEALEPEPLALSLTPGWPELLLPAGAAAELALSLSGPADMPPGEAQLWRQGAEETLLESLPLDALGDPLQAALVLKNDADAPREAALALRVLTDQQELLSQVTLRYLAWSGEWVWGDLHAHTNLSMDGCESPDDNCANRLALAGQDFYQQAGDRALDFAALTEHAEYVTWFPEGQDTAPLAIWPAQVALTREADGGPVLPILGYEWTQNATQEPGGEGGHYVGGHKTVLLPDLEGCEAARIAAPERAQVYIKAHRGALFLGGNPYEANKPRKLYQQLADSGCGEGALTFFHHGAYEWPQPVDWTLEHNAPDPDFEVLVEVYSEHGSSECADLEAPGCDWRLRSSSRYWGQGSAQAALAMGYRLGFTAGTDTHDGRPGSTEDGPSCTAAWSDEDGDGLAETPNCLDWRGGLTGALVSSTSGGPLEREALFEALRARRTVATSGPRPSVRALAVGADGGLYLPGEALSPQAFPARIVVEIEGPVAAEGVALIDAWGDTRAEVDGAVMDGEVTLAPGEAVYVRVHLEGDERIWISPWFASD